jgi:threonine dehydratase
MNKQILSLADIRQQKEALSLFLRKTPVALLAAHDAERTFGISANLCLKLEHFQHSGSFKLRGALSVIKSLTEAQVKKGLVTVSAGNHAIATAYAAQVFNTTAKVIMLPTANPERIRKAKSYGAEVLIATDGVTAFAQAVEIQKSTGRSFIHPFEGPHTTLGCATLGLEWMEQAGELDVAILPIGGGGLASGVAFALKEINPKCWVIGVNPKGAEAMYQSIKSGVKTPNERVVKIADSLCPPYVGDYTFTLCQKYLDEMVLVSEEEIALAMRLLFQEFKFLIEGAGAASLAAAIQLKTRFSGKRVGIIVCGSNIDPTTFFQQSGIE